jgi:hypothetical protein
LASITQLILGNNEIFFKNIKNYNIHILDLKHPLHFSLPKGEIFFTTGLLKKYIKHESVLVAIMLFEFIKSEHNLYPKHTFVPLGYVEIENMIQMNRLTLEESVEIHKWSYYLMKRAGYDGEYYLYWLQTQNRNTADFLMQVGDVNQINREESLFKAFLIREAKRDGLPSKNIKNSSKKFYKFINRLREV